MCAELTCYFSSRKLICLSRVTAIGIYNPPDVRPIIGAYIDKDVVQEYSKAEAESKRQLIEEWERSGGRRKSAPSFLGKLFGTSGSTTSVRARDFTRLRVAYG
jgi:hypothetical protein